MWIKTQTGRLLNLDNVTLIEPFLVDTSQIKHEDNPWQTVAHTVSQGAVVLAEHKTKEEVDMDISIIENGINRIKVNALK